LNTTLSNISLKKLNNNFLPTIKLTGAITYTINNLTDEKLSYIQNIDVEEPVDFNNGNIPNIEPLEFVTSDNLVERSETNKESRNILQLSDIRSGGVLKLTAIKPVGLLNLINLASLNKSSIDILDNMGYIIKTITNINDIIFNVNIVKYMLNNTNNNFIGNELENYSVIRKNQIPLTITNNNISIQDEVPINNLLISLTDLD
jgi:hypothetical protein